MLEWWLLTQGPYVPGGDRPTLRPPGPSPWPSKDYQPLGRRPPRALTTEGITPPRLRSPVQIPTSNLNLHGTHTPDLLRHPPPTPSSDLRDARGWVYRARRCLCRWRRRGSSNRASLGLSPREGGRNPLTEPDRGRETEEDHGAVAGSGVVGHRECRGPRVPNRGWCCSSHGTSYSFRARRPSRGWRGGGTHGRSVPSTPPLWVRTGSAWESSWADG